MFEGENHWKYGLTLLHIIYVKENIRNGAT